MDSENRYGFMYNRMPLELYNEWRSATRLLGPKIIRRFMRSYLDYLKKSKTKPGEKFKLTIEL